MHVPPATHTLKDFFIHNATICVDLLITIGLEQSIEEIYRHAEARELRESLQDESEQIYRDTLRVETALSADISSLQQQDEILSITAEDKHALGKLPKGPASTDFDIPDDPVHQAAKAGNKFSLLTQQ